MSKSLRAKASIIIFAFVICSALGVYPSVATYFGIRSPRFLLERTLKLGLDLKGGVHLVLAVHIPDETPQPERAAILRDVLQTIERRVNELGVSEPLIAPQGQNGNQILVQLPGMTDVDRAKKIIQSAGVLELRIVERGPAESADAFATNGRLPADTEVLATETTSEVDADGGHYLVQRRAQMNGRDIRSARPVLDENNRPAVGFTLNAEGGRRFGELTERNLGRILAVVLDGRIVSLARIENRITTDGRIYGNFTHQDAQNLSVILRSGSLTVPLSFLAQQTIGASLGADAIRAGTTASIVGLALIVVFLIVYYRWSGLNAVVALLLNLLIVLALMAYIGWVVTLPGIAGLVLTIGVGVDSNVLIFERIKEELESGAGRRQAIHAGFSRVFRTLLDTHVAALIAAAFLFQFGTGPIRGFAVTLSIGLFSNLLTSTFVSKTLFEVALTRASTNTLSI